MRLIIENRSDQVLTIYHDNYQVGSVEPGGRIDDDNTSMNTGRYPIEAKNAQGEVVFSETFTFKPKDKYHLQQVEERVYRAVIPPITTK